VRPLALPLLILFLGAAACSSSAPAPSASAACASFASWVRDQGPDLDAGKDMTVLRQAVALAPSGSLYSDMDTVLVNVTYAQKHPEADQVTQPDVQQVQADCSPVNPG
jgi:hypothetical protein